MSGSNNNEKSIHSPIENFENRNANNMSSEKFGMHYCPSTRAYFNLWNIKVGGIGGNSTTIIKTKSNLQNFSKISSFHEVVCLDENLA